MHRLSFRWLLGFVGSRPSVCCQLAGFRFLSTPKFASLCTCFSIEIVSSCILSHCFIVTFSLRFSHRNLPEFREITDNCRKSFICFTSRWSAVRAAIGSDWKPSLGSRRSAGRAAITPNDRPDGRRCYSYLLLVVVRKVFGLTNSCARPST